MCGRCRRAPWLSEPDHVGRSGLSVELHPFYRIGLWNCAFRNRFSYAVLGSLVCDLSSSGLSVPELFGKQLRDSTCAWSMDDVEPSCHYRLFSVLGMALGCRGRAAGRADPGCNKGLL